jgi:hypothetical protein
MAGIFTLSCVSIEDRKVKQTEREKHEFIGTISTEFISYQPIHIILKGSTKEKAYKKLLEAARKKYEGNIDIKNITIEGSYSHWNTCGLFLYLAFPIVGNVQRITASGAFFCQIFL